MTEPTIHAQPRTGDPCCNGDCSGHLVITTCKRRGTLAVRYLKCWRCAHQPPNGKVVVPAAEVPRRRPRRAD